MIHFLEGPARGSELYELAEDTKDAIKHLARFNLKAVDGLYVPPEVPTHRAGAFNNDDRFFPKRTSVHEVEPGDEALIDVPHYTGLKVIQASTERKRRLHYLARGPLHGKALVLPGSTSRTSVGVRLEETGEIVSSPVLASLGLPGSYKLSISTDGVAYVNGHVNDTLPHSWQQHSGGVSRYESDQIMEKAHVSTLSNALRVAGAVSLALQHTFEIGQDTREIDDAYASWQEYAHAYRLPSPADYEPIAALERYSLQDR